MPALSPAGLARYSRHILLAERGVAGQRKLAAARVLVVEAGGLGSPAALYLAATGVGTLGIADFDRVAAHNGLGEPMNQGVAGEGVPGELFGLQQEQQLVLGLEGKPWINFVFRSTIAFSSHLSRHFLKTREKVAVFSDL